MRPDPFYPYFRELTKAVPEGTKSLKIEKKQKNASHESKFSARGAFLRGRKQRKLSENENHKCVLRVYIVKQPKSLVIEFDAKEEEHEEQNNEKGIGYRDVSGFACILTGSSQCTGGCLETEQNRLVVGGG